LKNKFSLIEIGTIFSIGYYYASIYIPYYLYTFDLIDINKYPDLWKWSPSVLTLIASLIILVLAYICVNFAIKIFSIPSLPDQIKEINKYTLLFLSLIGGVSFVFIQYIIYANFFNERTISEAKNFEIWYLPALFATCCIYPIAEEIFFRKGILNLLDSKLNLIASIILSSTLFAFIHYPDYQQIVTTWIGGILLGVLYKKSNALIYPVVFHISWNTTVVISNFTSIF